MDSATRQGDLFLGRESARVLLVGAGGLGIQLAQQIVQHHPTALLTVADRNEAVAKRAARSARTFATAPANAEDPQWARLDVLDRASLDSLVHHADIVINAASMIPVELWWGMATDSRNGDDFDRLGLGPWLGLNLLLPDMIAASVATAAQPVVFVNGSYPDLVNAVIARRRGVVPLGFGNVALLEPPVRIGVARALGVPLSSVSVSIAAHYVHLRALMRGSAFVPPGLQIEVRIEGRPTTVSDGLLTDLAREAGASIPLGVASHPWTSSAFLAALSGHGGATHMAGPSARVGGYPVSITGERVELQLPASWDFAKVSAGLAEAQTFDGVAEIGDDGAIEFTAEAKRLYQKLFGASLQPLRAGDIGEIAREQLAHLRKGFIA